VVARNPLRRLTNLASSRVLIWSSTIRPRFR